MVTEPAENRARRVEREIADDFGGRVDDGAEIDVEKIAFDHFNVRICGERGAQALSERAIEFDQDQAARPTRRDALAQDAEAGADLDNGVSGDERGRIDDAIGDRSLGEEILSPGFAGNDARLRERRFRARRPRRRFSVSPFSHLRRSLNQR